MNKIENYIENYLEGKLNGFMAKRFEKKLKKDEKFRQRVVLHQNVDRMMRGAIMAAQARQEMIEKGIDTVAAGLVKDFFTNAN